jgi:hypothetical protein
LTPGDIHVYFSYIEQVRQGHFVSEDLYTGEPQARVMLNSFWSVLGLVAKITGLSNIIVFQLARIILIFPFLALLYALASYAAKEAIWRKIMFIFFCFASGIGLTIYVFLWDSVYSQGWYNWPLDLWASEHNNLMIMFQSPHFILSTIFIISILFLFYFSIEKDSKKYSIAGGLMACLLFQFHPFHAATVFSVIAGYLLVLFLKEKKINFVYIKQAVILGILSFPSIFYYLIMTRYDFVTQIRTYQNVCLTPSLWVTLLSYGFLFVLAMGAVGKIIRVNDWSNFNIFLVVWAVTQFVLLYSPLPFQRRLMQGLQVPMAILAVEGVKTIYNYLKLKWNPKKFDFFINNKVLLGVLFVLLFTTSHLYNWIREVVIFRKSYPQLYIPEERAAAYQWLKENLGEDEVTLTDLYNGNLIPGRTGRKVFVGHGVETLFYESKFVEMVWFYSINNFDDKKMSFLKRNGIDYVFWSANEEAVGDFKPEEKEYLEEVFEKGEVKIYKVK